MFSDLLAANRPRGVPMIRSLFMTGLLVTGSVDVQDGYSLLSIDDAVQPTDSIGPLKKGFACLPAGALRWSDIARPPESILLDKARRALVPNTQTMSETLPSSSASTARYEVTFKLKSVTMRLCVAGLGFGQKPRGRGSIVVDADTFDRFTRSHLPIRELTVDFDLMGRDPRRDPTVVADAIVQASTMYVAMGHKD